MEKSPLPENFELLAKIADDSTRNAAHRLDARARIHFAVERALSEDRVVFHYQPVVRAGHLHFPAFFEMLARLALPSGQLLPAAAFMSHIENGPLGRAIDRLALATALTSLASDPSLRVSVNMSPLSMEDPQWLSLLDAAATRDRGVTGRIIIEITETAALENSAQTLAFMNRVRGLGCAFALDDFGAGATGFRHFRDFRFDMVKIDGSFGQGVCQSADAQVLVECLLAVSRHFEMVTVAERIENQADAEFLRRLGVDCLQGYFCGRPSARPILPDAEAPGLMAG
jgi:EAL domain-containing protein (putative c-di-GMP-specific phosphodiesterase class I)